MKHFLLWGIVTLLLVTVSLSPVSADDTTEMYKQFMDMMSTEYIDNMSDLPAPTNLNPDKTIQYPPYWENSCEGDGEADCVFGWIDIVGFRDTIREDGVYYVNGDPAAAAIIEYGTYVRINGRYFLKNWIYDVQKSVSGDVLRAELRATAVLCQLGENGYETCKYVSMNFIDTETIPKQYPELNTSSPVNITIFNYTFQPKTTVAFKSAGLSKTQGSYKNSSLTHYTKLIKVDYTSKGVSYGNVTNVDYWNR